MMSLTINKLRYICHCEFYFFSKMWQSNQNIKIALLPDKNRDSFAMTHLIIKDYCLILDPTFSGSTR